jgi:carboxyl-terminal processing protease
MKHLKWSAFCLALLLAAPACRKTFFEPEPADTSTALFETLWRTFRDHYGPFNERNVNWQAAYDTFRPQINDQSTEEQLYTAMTGMLGRLNDGHVNLYTPDRQAFNSNDLRNRRVDFDLFDLGVVKKQYLTTGYETNSNGDFVYGLLPQGMIYVHFPLVSGNLQALERALDAFPEAKGLIVDLRHNDGGDFTWAFSAMKRLTRERRLVFSSRTKNGPASFTDWHDWYLEPGTTYFDKPIAVLTDRFTISAGERMALAFKVLPNCTMLGDTTCGALSTMIGGELANGWAYSIAIQNTRFADGKSYEGIGLAPDVVLRNDPVALKNGHDQVLEKAIAQLQ